MKADNIGKSTVFEKSYLPWFMCCIGMLFYGYNYFLRASQSPLQAELMQHLHMTASQFGLLGIAYYLSYIPMQIPAGMIYDRYGTRMVLFFACLTVVIGTSIFIAADDFRIACLGRFCIGLGTAFAYIGVLKIASLWLPANRFATAAGLTTAFGKASAIFALQYLTIIVQSLGYKKSLMTSLWLGIILSAFILFFLRSAPRRDFRQPGTNFVRMTGRQLLRAVYTVITNPQMWIIGLIGCLFYLPAALFLDNWGVPYLKTAYNLSAHEAANLVCLILAGWMLSGPTLGALSDRIKRRKMPLMISASLATVLISMVFYLNLPVASLYLIFFLFGICCGAHPLCFALSKENCPNAISGTAVAVTNTLIMCSGIVNYLVGKLLDMHSSGVLNADGTHVYVASDYTFALSVLPVGLFIAIGLCFFLKETYCEPHGTLDLSDDTQDELASNVVSIRA